MSKPKPVFSKDYLIYSVNTETLDLEFFKTFLTPEELKDLSGLTRSEVRNMRIFSQGFKRKILGEYLNYDPRFLTFELSPTGKPSVKTPENSIFFNLSHAGHWIFLGISEKFEIGIDVECVKKLDYLPLAKRFFHELEINQIENSQQPEETFFKLWCLKESFVKAIGLGLGYGLERFAIDAQTGNFLFVEPKYQYCQLIPIDNFEKDYFAAVCLA